MKTIKWRGFTIERYNGWINIYGTQNGQLLQERYLYYSLQEAKRLFRIKHICKNKN